MSSLSKSETAYPEVGRKKARDGNVNFSLISIGGMGIVPSPGLLLDGVAQRVMDIKHMETREDDIILVTFPKSGKSAAKSIPTIFINWLMTLNVMTLAENHREH